MKNCLWLSIGANALFIALFLFSFKSENKPEPQIVIEHELYNNIYLKARNHITVAVDGAKAEDIILKSRHDMLKISNLGHGRFELRPQKLATAGYQLEIYKKTRDSFKYLGKRTLNSRALPPHYIMLSAFLTNDVSGNGPEYNRSLQAGKFSIDNSSAYNGLNLRYQICGFTMVLQSKKKPKEKFISLSNKPTNEMKSALKEIKKGDKVIFCDAKIFSGFADTLTLTDPLIFEYNPNKP